jgi:Chemoreceptor zinc-binding domain
MPPAALPDWLSHYQANQKWIECGNKKLNVKDKKLAIFKLATDHWKEKFHANINSEPAKIDSWPITDKNKCPCGTWIRRAEQERLFQAEWLARLNEVHDDLHETATKVLLHYQDGKLGQARKNLPLLDAHFDRMTKLIIEQSNDENFLAQ